MSLNRAQPTRGNAPAPTIGKRAMKIRMVAFDPAARLSRWALAKQFLLADIAAGFVPFLQVLDGLGNCATCRTASACTTSSPGRWS